MNKPPLKRISIFLSLDQDILSGYFNQQDPSPLYKRQLSHEFEQYIMTCIRSAKRNSVFSYKICYKDEHEQQYAEPLMYAIRRHFAEAKAISISSFEKFKLRSYKLLFASLAIVMICQGVIPIILDGDNSIYSGLHNSVDVLCWVVLWKPIERLIFYWNPFLKDISILERLEKADVSVTEIDN